MDSFRGSLLNGIFVFFIGGAVLVAAFRGTMPEVTHAGIDSARRAVMDIALPLVGQMALWLGFMRVLRDAGVMRALARGLAPVMRRLFPAVPAEHPAMSAMIMNIAANVLGLGNAATPFGLKAMVELDRLNPRRGVATNAMALFLAINTSGVAVLPLGVIALRATLGAERLGGIILPSLLATLCSTIAGILVAKSLERRAVFAVERQALPPSEPAESGTIADGIARLGEAEEIAETSPPSSAWRNWLTVAFLAALAVAMVRHVLQAGSGAGLSAAQEILESWLLPLLMATIVMFGFSRRVKVYESFIQGAREGFQIAVMIMPFLVAILVAIGMFRASGLMELCIAAARPLTDLAGFPAEALPMALIRPLSGSGALAVMTETMTAYGTDSFVGFLVSVMNGSTETTFYVIAVYFGSVHVRAVRHTLAACLSADLVAIGAALLWCRLFF